MGAFSTVDDALDVFQVDVGNEIIGGVRERVEVSAGILPALAVVDGDAHSAVFWANLQNLCEAMATSFYDPSVGPGGYAGASSILPYTTASFRAAAGLHANGFRRATAWDPDVNDWTDLDDPMYIYGPIQADDIFGPWIYVDLQNALKALLWTRLVMDSPAEGHERNANSGGYKDCDVGRAYCIGEWAGSSWLTSDPSGWYQCIIESQETYGGAVSWTSFRRAALVESSDAVMPLRAQQIDCYESFGILAGAFHDFDALGVTENIYRLFETLPTDQAASRSRTGGEFGRFDDEPIGLSALTCPVVEVESFNSIALQDVCWIARWEFTHDS